MPYNYQKVSAPFTPEVKQLLDRVGSRKKSAYVQEAPAGSGMKLRSYWDGGSRDCYSAYNKFGQPIHLPISGAYGFTPDPKEWVPQEGDVLVTHGTFLGKPSTPYITFYK